MKEKPGTLSVWMAQIRAPFLILAVFLTLIGLAFAYHVAPREGEGFNIFHAFLLIIGIVSSHISVNLFNEYSDFRTKIDYHTRRSPFNGGSGMLTQNRTTPRQVLIASILTLVIAFSIGLYFTFVSHWFILVLTIIGGITIVSYTEGLARVYLGEIFAGLALGSLVIIGTYIAMTASPGTPVAELVPLNVILISIPPGLLTSLLLFINEFPDVEADKMGGRRHLVIALGLRNAGYLYAFGIFLTFGTILVLPLTGLASPWLFVALLPLPLGIKSSIAAIRHGDDLSKIIPALGTNVVTVLGTDFLLAFAVLVSPAL